MGRMWYKQGTMQSHLVSCEKGCRCLAKTGGIVNMSGKERQRTSRYCRRQYIGQKDIQCLVEETPRSISTADCENCQKYRNISSFQSALTVSKISRSQQNQRVSAGGSGSVPVLPNLKTGPILEFSLEHCRLVSLHLMTKIRENSATMQFVIQRFWFQTLKRSYTGWRTGGISLNHRKN